MAFALRKALLQSKPFFELLQSVLTSLAIIVGGFWTYRLFLEQRSSRPHLNIHHSVTSKVIYSGAVWLHLEVSLENAGDSLVSLKTEDVRIQQVLPLRPELQAWLAKGKNLVLPGSDAVAWPLVCRYEASFARQIEPKETDNLDFDFVIPAQLRTVRIYTYLQNEKSGKNALGWQLDSLYDLASEVTASGKTTMASNPPTQLIPCRVDPN